MAEQRVKRHRTGCALLAGVGMACALSGSASAQQTYPQATYPQQVYAVPVYAETPAAALARNVRVLASSPKDFTALIGAGRAALQIGDTQAAAAFFARADEVSPTSPLPQAGMGAATAQNGDPRSALAYFARAEQLGGSVVSFGGDRGLAYDLLGRQREAQADYEAALNGPDRDEARRRMALSEAISGQKALALQTIAPLIARRDAGANRVRALILALTGDAAGAMAAIDSAMPGSGTSMAPFLRQLPTLAADQKAAAVDLGIFPDAGQSAMAYAAPVVPPPLPPARSRSVRAKVIPSAIANARLTSAAPPAAGRLAEIDELLRAPAPGASPVYGPPPGPPIAPPTAIALAPAPASVPVQMASLVPPPARTATIRKQVWLQLASGANASALPQQLKRIRNRSSEILAGIGAYVAEGPDRARLLIGPFRSTADAEIIAGDLESVSIESFPYTNTPDQTVTKLPTE